MVTLIKPANPALSPAQVENILKVTADDLGSAGYDTYYGHGRINAAAAVLKASQTQALDTQAPSVSDRIADRRNGVRHRTRQRQRKRQHWRDAG